MLLSTLARRRLHFSCGAARQSLSRVALGTGLLLAILLAVVAVPVPTAEVRCGWYQAPTPGNLWLTDRRATWSITSQGQALGPDAAGAERAPAFDLHQFVETNVPGTGYGYGCACLKVETDAKSRRIVRVHSGRSVPLSQCRSDKSLPAPAGE